MTDQIERFSFTVADANVKTAKPQNGGTIWTIISVPIEEARLLAATLYEIFYGSNKDDRPS